MMPIGRKSATDYKEKNMEQIENYLFLIAVIIIGVIIIKKVASCLLRIVVSIILLVTLLGIAYFTGLL